MHGITGASLARHKPPRPIPMPRPADRAHGRAAAVQGHARAASIGGRRRHRACGRGSFLQGGGGTGRCAPQFVDACFFDFPALLCRKRAALEEE